MAQRQGSGRAAAVKAVLCVVALLAIYGSLNSYQTSVENARQFPDAYGADRARERFRGVIEKIPANAELGYFTDIDPAQTAYVSTFLAAQYALAPRLVEFLDDKAKPEFAVGNFSRAGDFKGMGEARGYELMTDFGNGVVLYKRHG
jgi:hypothetical protein